MKPKAIFFDLDGTLVDTAPDLAAAVNATLKIFNKPPFEDAELRYHISGGSRALLKLSFDIDPEHPEYKKIFDCFIRQYEARLCEDTRLFPGMEAVLNQIQGWDMPWGVVTNKYTYLARDVLAHFNLLDQCVCLVGSDSVTRPKPHPDSLEEACRLAQVSAHDALYVGDTHSDILAAKAAGMPVVAVTYGYHSRDTLPPDQWGADAVIDCPEALLLLPLRG